MKIRKKIQHFSSVEISLPTSWEELTQEHLKYIFSLIASDFHTEEVKTYAVIRFSGLKLLKRIDGNNQLMSIDGQRIVIDNKQLAVAVSCLDFLDSPSKEPVRLDKIGEATAVDAQLHGVPFHTYIAIENLYQGFLQSKNTEALNAIAHLLYDGIKDTDAVTRVCVLYWMSSVKLLFANLWPDFFRPSSGESQDMDMRALMDTEIRALTCGDITKEKEVMSCDTWRALTELNAKAREAQEFNQKMKQ